MKILIAADGSKHTTKALDYIASHRAMFVDGNELVIVNVCTGISSHAARHLSKEVMTDYYAEEGAKVLDPIRVFMEKQNIANYVIDQRHGHAAEEILKAATSVGAEMIVMGTHGHGIFGRALMGSIATKVISETSITVMLVQ
jgi:nucleotide-binding universal stress UspA family protein